MTSPTLVISNQENMNVLSDSVVEVEALELRSEPTIGSSKRSEKTIESRDEQIIDESITKSRIEVTTDPAAESVAIESQNGAITVESRHEGVVESKNEITTESWSDSTIESAARSEVSIESKSEPTPSNPTLSLSPVAVRSLNKTKVMDISVEEAQCHILNGCLSNSECDDLEIVKESSLLHSYQSSVSSLFSNTLPIRSSNCSSSESHTSTYYDSVPRYGNSSIPETVQFTEHPVDLQSSSLSCNPKCIKSPVVPCFDLVKPLNYIRMKWSDATLPTLTDPYPKHSLTHAMDRSTKVTGTENFNDDISECTSFGPRGGYNNDEQSFQDLLDMSGNQKTFPVQFNRDSYQYANPFQSADRSVSSFLLDSQEISPNWTNDTSPIRASLRSYSSQKSQSSTPKTKQLNKHLESYILNLEESASRTDESVCSDMSYLHDKR